MLFICGVIFSPSSFSSSPMFHFLRKGTDWRSVFLYFAPGRGAITPSTSPRTWRGCRSCRRWDGLQIIFFLFLCHTADVFSPPRSKNPPAMIFRLSLLHKPQTTVPAGLINRRLALGHLCLTLSSFIFIVLHMFPCFLRYE